MHKDSGEAKKYWTQTDFSQVQSSTNELQTGICISDLAETNSFANVGMPMFSSIERLVFRVSSIQKLLLQKVFNIVNQRSLTKVVVTRHIKHRYFGAQATKSIEGALMLRNGFEASRGCDDRMT